MPSKTDFNPQIGQRVRIRTLEIEGVIETIDKEGWYHVLIDGDRFLNPYLLWDLEEPRKTPELTSRSEQIIVQNFEFSLN